MDLKKLEILQKTHNRLYIKGQKKISKISPNYRKYLHFYKNVTVPSDFDWRNVMTVRPAGYQGVTGACFVYASLYSFCDRYAIALGSKKYIDMSFIAACVMMIDLVPNSRPLDGGGPEDFSQIFQNGGFMVNQGNDIQTNYSVFCNYVKDSEVACCDDTDTGFCRDIKDNNQQELDNFLKNDMFKKYNYDQLDPKYPDKEKFTLSFTEFPDAMEFESLKGIIYNGGPIPYTFFFNGDFYRGDFRETGGIYMCTKSDSNDNPFGYNHGNDGNSGGHCVSIIGYGIDSISLTYNGKKYNNVTVKYVIIRNSWGDDIAFPKVAWKQSINLGGNRVNLMNNVWKSTSIIDISKNDVGIPTYKCSGNSCIKCDSGESCIYTESDCNNNCNPIPENPTFKCSGNSCIKCGSGESCIYTESDCNNNCVGDNPENPTNYSYKIENNKCIKCPDTSCPFSNITSCVQKLDNTIWIILIIIGSIILSVLLYLIYKKNKTL